MAQRPKIIDTKQSYQPVDPATWIPESYTNERSDAPDVVEGAVAYDGFNFLPTSYGYKSYFGLEQAFLSALPDQCQELIFFQLDTLENIAIALCERGIWIRRANADWELVVVDAGGTARARGNLPANITEGSLTPELLEELGQDAFQDQNDTATELPKNFLWSYCVIENVLYCYRQSSERVWRISAQSELVEDNVVTFDRSEASLWTDDADGNLPAGLYQIFASFRYWGVSDGGLREELETAPVDLGQHSMPGLGESFQIRFENLSVLPIEIRITYSIDGGAWQQTSLFPPTTPNVNMLWREEKDVVSIDEFPPPTPVRSAGMPSGHVPTFLNMEGQLGIFRAGIQLGFWDSSNAVACSSVVDPFDFEPSVETLASLTTYPKVRGRIVTILPEENNFVIYSTKSIVRCVASNSEVQQWSADSLNQLAGIAYPKCVTAGQDEGEHYAYTNIGLLRIVGGETEVIFPALYDTLSQRSDEVIYLTCLAGRYLFFSSANPLYAPVEFAQTYIPPVQGLIGDGSACSNLRNYLANVRRNGPTLAGEMSLLNYFLSGKAGVAATYSQGKIRDNQFISSGQYLPAEDSALTPYAGKNIWQEF